MSDFNVLITSVSAKVLLVNEFKKAVADENVKGKIIGIDVNPLSAALYFCAEYEICPRLDDPNFLNYIERVCSEKNIKLIIPTRDEDVIYFSKNKHYLERKFGLKIMAPDFDVADRCFDKFQFFNFLTNNGLPTIKSWIGISNEITFPCVVKARRGSGARKFFIVESKTELLERTKDNDDIIIQEFVEGTEYTIDYFADFEGKCISIVPRVRITVIAGESKVGITVKDKQITELCSILGKKMGLVGHNVIQCFKTKSGEIKFIEVNPRFGGASNLSFAAGRRTPRYLIQLLLNKDVSVQPFKENLIMLRYSEDIFIDNYDKTGNL